MVVYICENCKKEFNKKFELTESEKFSLKTLGFNDDNRFSIFKRKVNNIEMYVTKEVKFVLSIDYVDIQKSSDVSFDSFDSLVKRINLILNKLN